MKTKAFLHNWNLVKSSIEIRNQSAKGGGHYRSSPGYPQDASDKSIVILDCFLDRR